MGECSTGRHWGSLAVPYGRCAIFLDRDGVLNRNIFYPDTQAWEAPRTVEELAFVDELGPALRALSAAGFLLFVVSNQPNVATGKSPPGTLAAMHAVLLDKLRSERISLADAFYCTHHPSVTGACPCRKPNPFFLQAAARAYALDLPASWMVGDRATDMECGCAAGARTAWIETGQEARAPSFASVDVQSTGLFDAAQQILARAV